VKAILATLIAIPLSTSTGWESLKFSKIPANRVEYTKAGLEINVDGSSSPLIYKFKDTEPIIRVEVSARMEGKINIADLKKQGTRGYDDVPLRFGLVLEGNHRLSWAKKLVAADWIKKMHAMAPPGKGLDHVLFLEAFNDPAMIGTKRAHYLNDLLQEEVVSAVGSDGRISINKSFSQPQKVLGLWISSSGDHAKSKFKLVIESINLYRKKQGPAEK
jgi:hypothetical protein